VAGRLAAEQQTAWDGLLFGRRRLGGGGSGGGPPVVPEGVLDLLNTPLFLWMAVESRMSHDPPPSSVGELFQVFTDWYLTDRHHQPQGARGEAPRFGLDDKVPVLEAVAEHLVEHGPVPLRHLTDQLRGVHPDGEAVLGEILASEFLKEEHDLVKFRHELFQAYWGGRVLARTAATDEPALFRRVLRFEWQESTRMLVGFADTGVDTVERICRTAADADARYGAWLLREARTTQPATVDAFVAAQHRILLTAGAGHQAWQRAATALTVLRSPAAWSALAEVITDRGTAAGAQVECLRAMGSATRHHIRPGQEGAATTALRGAVTDLLSRPVPVELEAAALRAVGQAGLLSLAAFLPDRVQAQNPWAVVREAAAALTALGIVLTPPMEAALEQACRRRLADADREAAEAPRASDTAALARERAELLTLLGRSDSPEALEVLLEHRFDPALSDLPTWSTLLTEADRARFGRAPADPLAALLLTESTAASNDARRQALQVFAEGTDTAAVAVAHRLLSDGEVPPRDLLELVSPGSSARRLLAAAAVVDSLAPWELEIADKLVRGLVADPRPEEPHWLDALAALVDAVGQQSHLLRVRLVHVATRELRRRGTARAMKGAWAQAYYNAEIDHETLVALLEQGDPDSVEVAMDYMSGVDFLLDAAGPPDRLALSPHAERRIVARRPALWADEPDLPGRRPFAPAEVVRYVQAVAYAGTTGAADFVKSVAASETAARTMIRFGHSRHGIVELAASAHAVTAVGWFGRLAGEQGRPEAAREAQAWLRGLDTGGRHPSLERARLVGLGLLGIWRPLLLGLTPDDPVLHDAAAQVVLDWLPTPGQTAAQEDHPAVARWITDRLASGEVDDPEVAAVLEGIVARLSRRLGRFFGGPPDPPGPPGRPT
jgi:hypothetical protein